MGVCCFQQTLKWHLTKEILGHICSDGGQISDIILFIIGKQLFYKQTDRRIEHLPKPELLQCQKSSSLTISQPTCSTCCTGEQQQGAKHSLWADKYL